MNGKVSAYLGEDGYQINRARLQRLLCPFR